MELPQNKPQLIREEHYHFKTYKEEQSYIVHMIVAYIPSIKCMLVDNQKTSDSILNQRIAIKYVRKIIDGIVRLDEEESVTGRCCGAIFLGTRMQEDYDQFSIELIENPNSLIYKITPKDQAG